MYLLFGVNELLFKGASRSSVHAVSCIHLASVLHPLGSLSWPRIDLLAFQSQVRFIVCNEHSHISHHGSRMWAVSSCDHSHLVPCEDDIDHVNQTSPSLLYSIVEGLISFIPYYV